MNAGRFPAVLAGASLAMAKRSQLEGRLMAILDPSVPRRGLTRLRAAAAAVMFAIIMVAVASVQPWAEERPAAPAVLPQALSELPMQSDRAQASTDARHGATQQDAIQGSVQGAMQGAVQGAVQGQIQGALQGAIQGPIQGRVQGAIQGALQGRLQGAAPAASVQGMIDALASGVASGVAGGVEGFVKEVAVQADKDVQKDRDKDSRA